ncbi:hypothetical protein ACU19_09005 [Actinobaculum suis]|uniref:hypothetical protein n=1 Tax=Actinobaculum suis TaxID=1657 RepID=UPI00066FC7BC|nr:hypothetical protein [Actinobaculum suis]KMY22629.1 hypothetical protein ACU19_09005 [Actinobaculum suis]
MSKEVTTGVLRIVQDSIASTRVEIPLEEAIAVYPKVQAWFKVNGRKPDRLAEDPTEKNYGEVLLVVQRAAQERKNRKRAEEAL